MDGHGGWVEVDPRQLCMFCGADDHRWLHVLVPDRLDYQYLGEGQRLSRHWFVCDDCEDATCSEEALFAAMREHWSRHYDDAEIRSVARIFRAAESSGVLLPPSAR